MTKINGLFLVLFLCLPGFAEEMPPAHTPAVQVDPDRQAVPPTHPLARFIATNIQNQIQPDKIYFLQGATNPITGKLTATLYQGTDAKGVKQGTPLNCVLAFTGRMGKRVECGGKPSTIEVLYTSGETDGGVVLYFRVNGALNEKYMRCSVTEKNKKLEGFSCNEVVIPAVKTENDLRSPIKGTIPEISVPNSHGVGSANSDGKFLVTRGMAVRNDSDYQSLLRYGVKNVLIFKDGVGTAIPDEISKWPVEAAKLNMAPPVVENIAFPWEKFTKFQSPCAQTIQALKILIDSKNKGEPVFFHCTVGEDRTGYLAALYRMITEHAKPRDLFIDEMCERGYEKGEPEKPYDNVVLQIRAALTKLYLRMAYKIEKGEITADNLDPSVCNNQPDVDDKPTLDAIVGYDSSLLPLHYKCSTSTRFRPGNY